MDERARVREELIAMIVRRGFRRDLAEAVADQLRTENMMRRMLGYLRAVKPRSPEELVDEMLAILSDRDRWIQKKTNEYYNEKYNQLLDEGLDDFFED